MEGLIKIVNSLEESRLLIKRISETIENEAKRKKGGFLPMLLGTWADSILVNASAGRVLVRAEKE